MHIYIYAYMHVYVCVYDRCDYTYMLKHTCIYIYIYIYILNKHNDTNQGNCDSTKGQARNARSEKFELEQLEL